MTGNRVTGPTTSSKTGDPHVEHGDHPGEGRSTLRRARWHWSNRPMTGPRTSRRAAPWRGASLTGRSPRRRGCRGSSSGRRGQHVGPTGSRARIDSGRRSRGEGRLLGDGRFLGQELVTGDTEQRRAAVLWQRPLDWLAEIPVSGASPDTSRRRRQRSWLGALEGADYDPARQRCGAGKFEGCSPDVIGELQRRGAPVISFEGGANDVAALRRKADTPSDLRP